MNLHLYFHRGSKTNHPHNNIVQSRFWSLRCQILLSFFMGCRNAEIQRENTLQSNSGKHWYWCDGQRKAKCKQDNMISELAINPVNISAGLF